MHQAAYEFVAEQRADLPRSPRVLEIGSYNVNGSVRGLFRRAEKYHGIDVREGPGVDEVADGASYDGKESFDVVVSTETLEHAPKPKAIIASAWKSLVPGGVLLLTAAGPTRAPHSCDGGPSVPPGEHYANIDPDALRAWLADWQDVEVVQNVPAGDVYARATKPETPPEASKKAAQKG